VNLHGFSVLRYVAASHPVPGEGGEGLQDGTVASAPADVALSLLNNFTQREKCYYLYFYFNYYQKKSKFGKKTFLDP
jgi:hypothetical protein